MMNYQTNEKLADMKLHAMNKEFRRQMELPAMDSMDFDGRFGMLVDAQWNSRKDARFNRLLKIANLREPSANLADIDFAPSRHLKKSQIAQLSDCQWIKEGHNLIMTGACGTGKTYILSAFGHEACLRNYSVKTYRINRLLTDLAIGRGDGSYDKLMNDLKKPDLLILDDFAMQVLEPSACRDLLEVVEERYGRKAIAISAQLPVKQWFETFEDATIADAVLDRLIHNAYRIELEDPTRRATPEELKLVNNTTLEK